MFSNFSKNIVIYCVLKNKKLFSLVLSCFRGWGIICLKNSLFLLKSKEFFSITFKKKSYFTLLKVLFLGFNKGYTQYLKLKGMGYKFINVSNNIVLKFGFSHRIIYSVYSNIYCLFINKYLIKLESRSFSDLKKVVYLLRSIRKNSMYKKKGIFLKGSLISLKISSKKAKF